MFFANNAGVLLEGGDMFVRNSDRFIRLNLACPRTILAEGLKSDLQGYNRKRTMTVVVKLAGNLQVDLVVKSNEVV